LIRQQQRQLEVLQVGRLLDDVLARKIIAGLFRTWIAVCAIEIPIWFCGSLTSPSDNTLHELAVPFDPFVVGELRSAGSSSRRSR
jgi:hypothetical protein